jgi:hypothetical protein
MKAVNLFPFYAIMEKDTMHCALLIKKGSKFDIYRHYDLKIDKK